MNDHRYWRGRPIVVFFLGLLIFVVFRWMIPLRSESWDVLCKDLFIVMVVAKLLSLYFSEQESRLIIWLSKFLDLVFFLLLGLAAGIVVYLSAIYKY